MSLCVVGLACRRVVARSHADRNGAAYRNGAKTCGGLCLVGEQNTSMASQSCRIVWRRGMFSGLCVCGASFGRNFARVRRRSGRDWHVPAR